MDMFWLLAGLALLCIAFFGGIALCIKADKK